MLTKVQSESVLSVSEEKTYRGAKCGGGDAGGAWIADRARWHTLGMPDRGSHAFCS